ncbi:MAG: hypothetical protein V4732_12585 [Pseudomonadota bacterium]
MFKFIQPLCKPCGLVLVAIVFLPMCIAQVHADTSDPTRPLRGYVGNNNENTTEQSSIRLNSILVSSQRKIAIINGQQLYENQVIKGVGAKVKKIDIDSVTLQQGNKVWRILLNETVVRQ